MRTISCSLRPGSALTTGLGIPLRKCPCFASMPLAEMVNQHGSPLRANQTAITSAHLELTLILRGGGGTRLPGLSHTLTTSLKRSATTLQTTHTPRRSETTLATTPRIPHTPRRSETTLATTPRIPHTPRRSEATLATNTQTTTTPSWRVVDRV